MLPVVISEVAKPWRIRHFACLAITFLAVYVVVSKVRSFWRLRSFRGPFLGKISEFWILKTTLDGNFNEKSLDVIEKYGGAEAIAQVGPNLLVTSNAAWWKLVNEDRAWKKGSWYPGMALDPGHDSVFSTTDDVVHDRLKNQLTRGYSGKDNPNLEKDIEGVIKKLFQFIDSNPTFDLAVLAQYFTVDVLSTIAFGKAFGCLPTGKDMYDYIKTSHVFIPILELKLNHIWFNNITNTWLFQRLLAPTSEDRVGMGKVIGIAKAIVREKFESREQYGSSTEGNGQDMLDSFIEKGLTQEEVEAESLLQIMAGADSTATALRCTLFYTMSNPVVWRKLQLAIDEEAKEHTNVTFIPESSLRNIPYLEATIKEGLRMWPPLTGHRCKVAPPQGCFVGDKFIPGGTEVGQCVWSLRRDTETFGADAIQFRPERWLEAGHEQLEQMEAAVGTLFGNGRHRCLGRTIALIELRKVIAELVHSYDLSIVDPVKPFDSRCNGIHLQSNMNVSAVRRI